MTGRGVFITFEGGEGAGKTTQIGLLARRLRQHDLSVHTTREPGGTPLGEKIRQLLVTGDPASMNETTELLLMVAARSAHAREIAQHLNQGAFVLCDRFGDSSLAYQGHGRGLDIDRIRQLNTWATGGLTPDLTFLLDIDPAAGLNRTRDRLHQEDRFEKEQSGFHQRVNDGFRQLAAAEPGRFRVLDATLNAESLAERIWHEVAHVLPRL